MNRIKSTVDEWLKTLVWMTVIGSILLAVATPVPVLWLTITLVIPISGFALWIYLETWYAFEENHLLCKSGPFQERIAYAKIRSVRLSENLWSSMALSRKRIEIRQHGKGFITGTTYISPEDRESFLAELKSRCENLDQ